MTAGSTASMTPSPPATAPLAEGEVADGRVLHTDRPPVSPEADQPWLRPALLAVVIAAHGLAAAWLIAPPQPDGVMPPQAPPSPRLRKSCKPRTRSSRVSLKWHRCSARPGVPVPQPTRRRWR